MRNRIYIKNDQKAVKTDAKLYGLIRRAIGQALKYEKFPSAAEISVILTDNEGIKSLNSEYRNKDSVTDVLSFPLYSSASEAVSDTADGEEAALGDIVISLEKAVQQANEYGHGFERETAFLCVHSVLHLLGYDHELGPEQEKEMFTKQEEVMRLLGLTR